MGSSSTRILEVPNLQSELAKLQLISQKNCPIYGSISYVQYNNIQFYLAQHKSSNPPDKLALHYLIEPNLLLIPQYQLLEEMQPNSTEQILKIINGIAQIASEGIGVGYRRIGYAGRWGVVGQRGKQWNYYSILQQGNNQGIFLSPQQMVCLSKKQTLPKYNLQKADVFCFGIILLQIIFQQSMNEVFDYKKYQIKLKPILKKIIQIKKQYGQELYEILLKMLEIEESDRIGFQQLRTIAYELLNNQESKGKKQRPKQNSQRKYQIDIHRVQPNISQPSNLRNDLSPFRRNFGNIFSPRSKLQQNRSNNEKLSNRKMEKSPSAGRMNLSPINRHRKPSGLSNNIKGKQLFKQFPSYN